MSTRSYIFVESTEGGLDGVYCHCNGYLEGVWICLKEAYSGSKNAQKRHDLIALVDLSSLGRSLEPSVAVELFGSGYYMKPEFDKLSQHAQDLLSADARGVNFTVAYHRDRGEKRK